MTATGTLVWPELLTRFLRPPLTYGMDPQGNPIATFEPPLSGAEQTTFNDIILMAKLGLTNDLSLAEFQAIKPDLATAKTFVGISSPTAAQSNAALKATIRVLVQQHAQGGAQEDANRDQGYRSSRSVRSRGSRT